MAKQSGIHQLRGKVGEHSYYRQTGVDGGLVRRINQGMAERVKTDAAFANTRLNNAEFGAAAAVAGLLGKMVVPKYRPMVLPFSQSKMAKDILEIARQSGGSWGQRVVTSSDTEALCEILTNTSKLVLSDFADASIVRDTATTVTCDITITDAQASALVGLGVSGVSLNAAVFDLATGKYVAAEGGIHKSYYRLRGTGVDENLISAGSGSSINTDITIPETFSPTPELYNGHRIAVMIMMPFRTINGVNHILQEYCCFVAFPVPNAE